MRICDKCTDKRAAMGSPTNIEHFGFHIVPFRARCEQCGKIGACIIRSDLLPIQETPTPILTVDKKTLLKRLDNREREIYKAMKPKRDDVAGSAFERVWRTQNVLAGYTLREYVRFEQLFKMIRKLTGDET